MQHPALEDRFCGQRLEDRPRDDPAVGNAEPVTELERSGADDDLLASHLVESRGIAAQRVDIGDARNGGCTKAEVDQEGRPPVGILPGQHDGHRRHQGIAELLAERITTNEPVGFDRDVDDGRPRLVAETLQGAIDVRRAAIRRRLLEGRQDRRAADIAERLDEGLVGRRIGRRTEIDVERDVPRARRLEPAQQLRVEPARPRPHPDLIDGRCVDGHHDDIAAGRTRLPAEPQIGERVAKRTMPSRGQHDRKRDHDENMRPITFHPILPRTRFNGCAPSSPGKPPQRLLWP
ncbi:hypothetical protein ABIF96_008106 [Bradyrhizobium ottawaense]